MMRALLGLLLLSLCACATPPEDIGRAPDLSPVGRGLHPQAEEIGLKGQQTSGTHGANSLWSDRQAAFYSDARAMHVGDVLTVNIAINDSATLGNTSDRSREAKANNAYDILFGTQKANPKGYFNSDVAANTSTKGQGSIDRSEKIQLAIAAIVTDVLPNGNLLISGSQEVRVNYELRDLNISGLVRPRDISKDNMIAYDKIAEARISYGGRGRMSEFQQPAVIQQMYDAVAPF